MEIKSTAVNKAHFVPMRFISLEKNGYYLCDPMTFFL